MLRSKKGDFVVTIEPGPDRRRGRAGRRRGQGSGDVRALDPRGAREAKQNRAAAVGLVVFSPAHAPAGIAPFDVRAGDVYCVIDPADPDPATLEAALRLARLLAIASLRDVEAEVDVEAIRAALAAVRAELEPEGDQVDADLDLQQRRRASAGARSAPRGVIGRVAEAEAEIRAARVAAAH